MATLTGEPTTLDSEKFIAELDSENTSGFFAEGRLSCRIDTSDFSSPTKVFPTSRLELNLYKVTDLAILIEELSNIERGLHIDLGFVIEDESFIAEYNSSELGIGLGLPDIYWINYYGELYSKHLITPPEPSPFQIDESLGQPKGRLVVTKSTYDGHLALTEEQKEQMRQTLGRDNFSTYEIQPHTTEASSSWILSPTNISRIARYFRKQATREPFQGQARVVPNMFRKK